jgi:catechol 2,3-dioxygenase-like lactoylglutathione lyase family enzyme
MRLEHLNLVVKDIPAMLEFYQAAFPHWRIREQGTADWYGVERTWLHFGDDYNYLTLNDDGEGENRDLSGHQVGLAHFGYVVDDVEGVKQRLIDAGYEVANPGADNPYRSNVYFIDPAGYEVEFVQYHSDIPEQRNNNL